jgi:predicted nucleotidyltransferase
VARTKTEAAERTFHDALTVGRVDPRGMDSECSLVLFGSYARHEVVGGSDYDWALLVDGVADVRHGEQARRIDAALKAAGLTPPGASGTFGNMVYSHDLVHHIGGSADSNFNLTRRMLMLLESRPHAFGAGGIEVSRPWNNVVANILARYFEEEVHFSSTGGSNRVPRFLLNDLTRYWRTICVDYAAKHREQDGRKWALRNAKIRLSRKLLYAAGLAFCLGCELRPPNRLHPDLFDPDSTPDTEAFRASALRFAQTPPLEYLAAFVDSFVEDPDRRKVIARRIFGAYNEWLLLLDDTEARRALDALRHDQAADSPHFQKVRALGSEFASGLRQLFFNRDTDPDPIARLSLDYVGF